MRLFFLLQPRFPGALPLGATRFSPTVMTQGWLVVVQVSRPRTRVTGVQVNRRVVRIQASRRRRSVMEVQISRRRTSVMETGKRTRLIEVQISRRRTPVTGVQI